MELKMIENYSSERRDNLEDMQPNETQEWISQSSKNSRQKKSYSFIDWLGEWVGFLPTSTNDWV